MIFRREPPVTYQCPNAACRCGDFIVLAILTRPLANRPWKHRPVGSTVKCARCSSIFNITNQGIVAVVETLPVSALTPRNRPLQDERLSDLIDDMRLQTERGV